MVRVGQHFTMYEIKPWHAMEPGERNEGPRELQFARQFLGQFALDPIVMAKLRDLAGHAGTPRDDQELLETLAGDLSRGTLCVVRTEKHLGEEPQKRRRAKHDLPPRGERLLEESGHTRHVPITPSKPVTDDTWIEFRLLDEDTGDPVPGIRLRLTLPDGSVCLGVTNEDGRLHTSGFPQGTCDLEQILAEEAFEVVQFA